MTSEQVDKIVEMMRSRMQGAENLAGEEALRAVVGPKTERTDHEQQARSWYQAATVWKEAAELLVVQTNEFFRDGQKRRKK